MKAYATWLLAATLVAIFGSVAAQQCSNDNSCSPAIYCIHGERRHKPSCRLSNGATGVCCSRGLTQKEKAPIFSDTCTPRPNCNGVGRYRTADGSCLSNRDPRLGMSGTAFTRLLPAAYGRNSSQPIRQPLPRDISRIVFADGDRPHPFLALTTSHWGQLLAHDLSLSNAQTMQDGSDISCCRQDGSASADFPPAVESQCSLRIGVRRSDPFYGPHIGCLNFVRAEASPPNCYNYGADGSPSVIRQINQATHYLDASMVYGSSLETQRQLRTGQGGRLKVLNESGKELLPLGPDSDCAADAGGCFMAGDPRSNVVPALAALHTLLLREHNRIAEILAGINPSWNDETLFQEARLVVIAEIQHITLKEWLPGIIGPDAMRIIQRYIIEAVNGRRPPPGGAYNPSISAEFAGAAFRFGHSTVDGRMNLRSARETLRLAEYFHRSGRLRENGFYDRVLRWMVENRMQKVDRFVTVALRGLLDNTTTFEGQPFGGDLVSSNIARGHDYGLRRYIEYCYLNGMKPVTEWGDLRDRMEPEIIDLLRQAYEKPRDVDLFVGGILEIHAPGAAVGPTFQSILAEQFARTILGDRDFYIFSDKFSVEQVRQIRNASLSRLICDNADVIRSVPRNSFRIPDERRNPVVSCRHIPVVNLTAWYEH